MADIQCGECEKLRSELAAMTSRAEWLDQELKKANRKEDDLLDTAELIAEQREPKK